MLRLNVRSAVPWVMAQVTGPRIMPWSIDEVPDCVPRVPQFARDAQMGLCVGETPGWASALPKRLTDRERTSLRSSPCS